MTGPEPLRRMDQPARDGKSASCWNPAVKDLDVHYSSGVANKFFYSLAVGSGTTPWGSSSPCGGAAPVTGIGNDAAGAIWYRALTTYMVSSTDFAGARTATLQAAADLYGSGSVERSTVQAAWLAVGVDGSGTVPPSSTAPVIEPIELATTHVGTPVRYQLTGSDPQGQTIAWRATNLPTGVTITSDGLISGVPTAKSNLAVRIEATDPDGNRTSWTSEPWFVKGPPRLALTPPGPQTFNVGTEASFKAYFEDYPDYVLDQRPVTVEASGLPAGMTVTTSNDPIPSITLVTVKGTPTTVGTGTIRFTATDADGETATATVPWTVASPLAPATPEAYVTAAEVSGTAVVAWAAPVSGSMAVTGYVVRVTPGSQQVLPATARSVTLTGLDITKTYEIGVVARGNGADSAEKTLKMEPTTVTLAPLSLIAGHADPVTLTGTIAGPVASPRAYLEQRPATATTWTRVATLTTAAWNQTVNPTVTTAYRVSYPPQRFGLWPATSATSTITVRYAVTVTLSTTSATANQTVTFTGTVRPATPGVLASLQRYTDGEWVTVQSTPVTAAGTYAIGRAFARGTWNLRVVASGGGTNAYGFTSAVRLAVS